MLKPVPVAYSRQVRDDGHPPAPLFQLGYGPLWPSRWERAVLFCTHLRTFWQSLHIAPRPHGTQGTAWLELWIIFEIRHGACPRTATAGAPLDPLDKKTSARTKLLQLYGSLPLVIIHPPDWQTSLISEVDLPPDASPFGTLRWPIPFLPWTPRFGGSLRNTRRRSAGFFSSGIPPARLSSAVPRPGLPRSGSRKSTFRPLLRGPTPPGSTRAVATPPVRRLALPRRPGRGGGPSPSFVRGRPAAPPPAPPCLWRGTNALAAGLNLPAGHARPGSMLPGLPAPIATHRHKLGARTAPMRPPWSPPWAGDPVPMWGRRLRRGSPGLARCPWEVAVAHPAGFSLWRLRSTEPQRGRCRSGRTPACAVAPRTPRAVWALTRWRTTAAMSTPCLPGPEVSRRDGTDRNKPLSCSSGGGPSHMRATLS